MKKLGLYCHIPFCASTCDFCAFYQKKPKKSDVDDYINSMDIEFSHLPKDKKFNTIFWGGGTPSILSGKDLFKLGKSMLKNIDSGFEEWSVEMAPSTVKPEKINALLDLGVTRFSLGIQSFDSKLLNQLGRLHNPHQIYKAWDIIKSSGVNQTNIDMMFALPSQSLEQLESDLAIACSLESNHISTYCLTFEEDTALYIKLLNNKLKVDREKEREFFLFTWDYLLSKNYSQYEISNFSRNNTDRCQHNINTWKMYDWIGCGPSASSQYQNKRYKNPNSIREWVKKINNISKVDILEITNNDLLTDSLIFGLRMNDGIDLNHLFKCFPSNKELDKINSLFDSLIKEKYMIKELSNYRLTKEGRLRCDAIGLRLLDL